MTKGQMNDADYQCVHSHESWGELGALGLKILVARPRRDLPETVKGFFGRRGEELYEELLRLIVQADPATEASAQECVRELVGCFPESERIYTRRLANQYCKQVCCLGRPWLQVTTRQGDIVLGWRKCVLSLDWSGSDITATAKELFPAEETTKCDRLIHAWGLDKLREYIQRLLTVQGEKAP